LEYAVLFVCVAAALLAMQIYLKRSFEGRFREAAESVGQQYSAGHTSGSVTITRRSSSQTTVDVDDSSPERTLTTTFTTIGVNGPDRETNKGSIQVDSLDKEALFD
jgi:Flp pilus assembly pilin Flp